MIIFKKATAKNFMSIGDVPIEVILDSHKTTLVTGKNGNGKSGAIIEPIVFALFGKSFRGVNKQNLINSVNQKNCFVTVEFSIGPDNYLVERGMKPTVFNIYKNNTKIDNDAASRDYQKYLETQILRTNYKSFCQVVILGSAAYTPFMQLKAAERREVIETILDISVFSGMNKILKETVKLWKDDVVMTKARIISVKDSVDLQSGFISDLENKKNENTTKVFDEIKAIKLRTEELVKENAETKNKIAVYNKTIDGLDSTILKEQVSSLQKQEAQLINDKKRYKKEYKFFEENTDCHTCGTAMTDKHRKSHMNDLLSKLTGVDTAIAKLEHDTKNAQNTLQSVVDIEAKIKTKEKDQEILHNKIVSLAQEGKKLVKKLKEQKTDSTESIDGYKLKLDETNKALTKHKTALKGLLNKKQTYELSVDLLKDTGIKSSIIKQYLPVLNSQTNKYMRAMNFNLKFKLDENFKEQLTSRFSDEFTYGNFSMGERIRIDLALLFAWRDVAKMKNSVNCNLLILDEVMDSSLDEQGLDDLMAILNNIKDVNIFVISHREGIEDKFKNNIAFVKNNSFTKLVDTAAEAA